MTVADYVLAFIGLFICVAWCGGSFFVSIIDAFAPAPDKETAATARKGCAALVAGLAVAAWFVGVLWNGDWGWLS